MTHDTLHGLVLVLVLVLGLVRLGLAWLGLVRFGSVRFGSVRFGLMWFGLVWFCGFVRWLVLIFGRRACEHLARPHRNIVHQLGFPRETHMKSNGRPHHVC